MPQVFEEVEMTKNTWISSKEALRLAKAQDATAGDLLEWARQGKLRARALKGSFGNDEPGEERIFPSQPPVDEVKRSVAGDWPDIPADFWEETPAKALWTAGTFATRVWYFEEHYQQYDWQRITLSEVTFNAAQLEALLSNSEGRAIRAMLPRNAPPNAHLYEETAHLAAELVRTTKISRAVAFRTALSKTKVAQKMTTATRESAVRRAYVLMYDERGMPVQKDLN
jgi:hypothetical protein